MQSDWTQNDNQAPDYIKNKPTLAAVATSGDYDDLINTPTIPTATSDLTNDGEDGINPFITAADVTPQVNSDWDATSGVAEILNKPTIPAAVTKTSDLTNDGENGVDPFITAADVPASVTSVGLTMPSAFSVANSPITSSGTLEVTGAGVVSQYVRGDGSLANFPTSTGGGASLSFYLNGSVSQGTIGGVAFREMDRTPILGAGTDFTIAANGYIQSFITDANVPNLLEIPAGNWNFETYFSASSNGGNPSFYLELYKWNGTTLSLIASNSANPEGITNGTAIDLYVSALAVPQTTLLATDRLAVRIYVTHSGRTIKLHTENSHLCQVITTFSTGLTALNGLTTQVQSFATGTSGTDFGISSATSTHTFNLPTASAANRGALSSTDWSTFNGKQDALVSGTNIKTINGASVLGSGDLVVGGTNIYGSDGSLTAARTLTLNSFPLTFAGTTSTRFYANGSIGVNQLTDIASAQLTVSSTTKGVLIPRMTLAQRNAITTPAAGLQVVVTGETFGEFLSFYNADRVIWERAVMSRSSVLSCVFVGQASGFNVTAVTNSNFIGNESGSSATAANSSNFLGNGAGKNATNAANSNFLGAGAGLNATNAQQSTFLGLATGEGATGALQSFFVGSYTGYLATGASGSNFIGNSAGANATNASNSNFIGRSTGTGATGANHSNFIGFNVGNSTTHAITGANNILIGTNITTPTAATANSANIGGVLYLNNTYATTSGNPRATAQTNGKVGINTTTPAASAVLEIVSTTGGVLFPRMTTTEKNAIVTPTAGLVVYDTTLGKLCVRTAAAWETITSI